MAMRDIGSHAPRLKAMGRPKALGSRRSGRAGEPAAGESVRASESLDDVPQDPRLPAYPPIGPTHRLRDLYGSLSTLLGIISTIVGITPATGAIWFSPGRQPTGGTAGRGDRGAAHGRQFDRRATAAPRPGNSKRVAASAGSGGARLSGAGPPRRSALGAGASCATIAAEPVSSDR